MKKIKKKLKQPLLFHIIQIYINRKKKGEQMAKIQIINHQCSDSRECNDAKLGNKYFIHHLETSVSSSVTYIVEHTSSVTYPYDINVSAVTDNAVRPFNVEVKTRYPKKSYNDIIINTEKIDELYDSTKDTDRTPLLVQIYPNDKEIFFLDLRKYDIKKNLTPKLRKMTKSTSSYLTPQTNHEETMKMMYEIPKSVCKKYKFIPPITE